MLTFVPSSYVKRFNKTRAFTNKLAIDTRGFEKVHASAIHLLITDRLNQHVNSANSREKPRSLFIPFSIAKGTNYYGVVFSTTHYIGAHKFLSVAWEIDCEGGYANHDIKGVHYRGYQQGSLFDNELLEFMKKPVLLKHALRDFIKQQQCTTNHAIFEFTLRFGCLQKHSRSALKELRKERRIDFDGNEPKVTDQWYDKPDHTVHFYTLE